MDSTFAKLSELYLELLQELENELSVFGGTVEKYAPEDQLVYILVDKEYEDYAQELVATIIKKYDERRMAIMTSDAFMGVKQILWDADPDCMFYED